MSATSRTAGWTRPLQRPSYQSFERDACCFVLLDTPVFNTGWEAELEQWEWLEETLAEATARGRRLFLFGHYPLYLWDPEEAEHRRG